MFFNLFSVLKDLREYICCCEWFGRVVERVEGVLPTVEGVNLDLNVTFISSSDFFATLCSCLYLFDDFVDPSTLNKRIDQQADSEWQTRS